MATEFYPFAAFVSQGGTDADLPSLEEEVIAVGGGLASKFEYSEKTPALAPTGVTFTFTVALTAGEQTQLDGVVAAHQGTVTQPVPEQVIQGTLADGQIYVYDTAQVAFTNVTVSGDIASIDAAGVVTIDNFTDSTDGFAPASGGGTANFLRADGTWAVPPGTGGGGAPTDAQYVVLALDATLTDERVLVAGAGLALTDGGPNGNVDLDVGAGTGIAVNANDVQLDLADNRNIDHSAVVLTAGAGLTGTGDITASRTFDIGAGNGITVNADDIEIDTAFLDGLYVTLGAPAQTITTLKTFNPFGTGVIGQNDIVIGDITDYGLAAVGLAVFGRTNFNAAALDLDGSVLSFNTALPATSNIEFAWVDGTNSIRFALAVPGVGNATYNPRSMLIAGPAVLDDEVVTVSYWQTNNNIFDNLVCDTVGQGADLGVQNDLEVEGQIWVDLIQESTPANGVVVSADDGSGVGSFVWDGNQMAFQSASSPTSSFIIGYGATGDPTTPMANRINLSGLSGFSFIMSNAAFPQFIIGNTDPTSSVFIDGNGNKAIRFNTLDTGFDQDNAVFFGYGGINLQDQGGDATFIRSAAAVAGTYTITLPDGPGAAGQVLVNLDGAATLDWEDPAVTGIYSVWAEENAALAAGAFEWAFGNGANTPIDGGLTVHVPPGYTCEVFAMSLRLGSGTATVQLYLNGVAQGPNGQVAVAAGQGASVTLGTPIAVVDGDFINFQTVAAAGTSAPNVVTAWLRVFPT